MPSSRVLPEDSCHVGAISQVLRPLMPESKPSRKRNQKKAPVPRALRVRLCVAAVAGRAGTRPAHRGAQTAAASFPSGATMRRPRDNGERRDTIATFPRGVSMSPYIYIDVVHLLIRHAGPPTSSLRRKRLCHNRTQGVWQHSSFRRRPESLAYSNH
jgi:hypothetical protein